MPRLTATQGDRSTAPTIENWTDEALAAFAAAEAGWPTFPLAPGTKDKPLGKAWQQAATTDLEQLRRWWRANPHANPAIVPGRVGVMVLDLDRGHAEGVDGVANWEALGLADKPGALTATPRGGFHGYFRIPDGQPVPNSAGKIAAGIDVRSGPPHGYVLAPGARTPRGTYQESLRGYLPRPEDLPPASEGLLVLSRARKGHGSPPATQPLIELPAGTDAPPRNPPGLLDHAVVQPLTQAGLGAAVARELAKVWNAAEGTRQSSLNEASFALGQRLGESPSAGWVQHALRDAARHSGLDDPEIEGVVPRAFADGAANPRAVAPVDTPAAVNLFQPLDLTTWLAEDHPAPAHFGAGRVLYEGGFTLLMGEPESGKSVLAYGWAVDVIRTGRRVLLLDEEAGPLDALGKMRALGATDAELAAGLVYLPPLGRNLVEQVTAWAALVRATEPGLVIVDSFAATLANSRKDENANADVTQFVNAVLLPVTQQVGAAVVVIDHKTKAAAPDSRWSRGASAKLGLVDLALNVRATQPFSKARSGTVEVKVTKDRWGDFGRDTEWSVTVGTGDGHIVLSFLRLSDAERADRAAEALSQVADRQMEQVLAAVTHAMPDGLTGAGIEQALRGRDGAKGLGSNTIRRLVKQALAHGQLAEGGARVAGHWSLVIPPTPADDTLSGGEW